MEQNLKELATYLCSMKKKDISAEKAFEMAHQIADEFPDELRPKEALCETYCIIGHIYNDYDKDKKCYAIETAYDIYEQIKDTSDNKYLYILAQYMLLDRCVIQEAALDYVEMLQELQKIDRDYRPYVSALIIKICICHFEEYRELFLNELELLENNLEHNRKNFGIDQCIDAYSLLEEKVYKDIIQDEEKQKDAGRKYIDRIQYRDTNRWVLNVWDIELLSYVDYMVKLLRKEYDIPE